MIFCGIEGGVRRDRDGSGGTARDGFCVLRRDCPWRKTDCELQCSAGRLNNPSEAGTKPTNSPVTAAFALV